MSKRASPEISGTENPKNTKKAKIEKSEQPLAKRTKSQSGNNESDAEPRVLEGKFEHIELLRKSTKRVEASEELFKAVQENTFETIVWIELLRTESDELYIVKISKDSLLVNPVRDEEPKLKRLAEKSAAEAREQDYPLPEVDYPAAQFVADQNSLDDSRIHLEEVVRDCMPYDLRLNDAGDALITRVDMHDILFRAQFEGPFEELCKSWDAEDGECTQVWQVQGGRKIPGNKKMLYAFPSHNGAHFVDEDGTLWCSDYEKTFRHFWENAKVCSETQTVQYTPSEEHFIVESLLDCKVKK